MKMQKEKVDQYNSDIKEDGKFRCLSVRKLNDSAYVLRMNRNGLEFKSGQYITLGLGDSLETREYSIYSGVNDDFLEVLIRKVDDGNVSKQLSNVQPGDELNVDGPFGFFCIPEKDLEDQKILLIATGTGISPFHGFVKSYPNLDYTLIHGIAHMDDAFEKETYDKQRYISCCSQEKAGDFQGRLTEYLKTYSLEKGTKCYLCGNCNMIYDAFDILTKKGVSATDLHAEVYF